MNIDLEEKKHFLQNKQIQLSCEKLKGSKLLTDAKIKNNNEIK